MRGVVRDLAVLVVGVLLVGAVLLSLPALPAQSMSGPAAIRSAPTTT